jgi:hypothetical protein
VALANMAESGCIAPSPLLLDAQVLAAEVLALRADLQLFLDASEAAEKRIVELREELARRPR